MKIFAMMTPNRFWEEDFDDSDYHKYDHMLHSGDFNVSLNHEIDNSGYLHIKNPQLRQYINSRIATN